VGWNFLRGGDKKEGPSWGGKSSIPINNFEQNSKEKGYCQNPNHDPKERTDRLNDPSRDRVAMSSDGIWVNRPPSGQEKVSLASTAKDVARDGEELSQQDENLSAKRRLRRRGMDPRGLITTPPRGATEKKREGSKPF